jgi:hypothetical protein
MVKMADITVQFGDGTTHVYNHAPDNLSQQDVIARASKDFAGKEIKHLDRAVKPMSSLIPDTRVDAPQAQPELTTREKISGAIETPLAIAANMVSGPLTYLAGAGGKDFQNKVAEQIQYQPRTQVAQDALAAIGRGMEESKIPPFMPGFQMAPRTQSMAAEIAPQARNLANQAVSKVEPQAAALADMLRKQEPQQPQMIGVGSAATDKALNRQVTAENLRVPVKLTKGQATRDPSQQQFEIETAKTYPDTSGKPLVQRQAETNQNILRNFDNYVEATGAEQSGLLRPIGQIVDEALVGQANQAKQKINAAYEAAKASGETKALVPYEGLTKYIEQQGPTVKEKLAPILGAVEDQIFKNDPQGTGMVSIDALEDIYKFINQNAQEGTPNAVQARQLKNLINASTEGAGGDLYREARNLRAEYGKQFENVGAVDKLLRTKLGTSDRAVAYEDVFNHSIINGSFDDTRNIALLLKKGGDKGQQAWKELQGQTIEYIKDQATKNIQRDSRGNPVPSAAAMDKVVRNLDADGKLDYIFGKKGAQEIRDLRDTSLLVYSPVKGAANESNTASALIRGLRNINQSPLARIPGVGSVAKYAEESANQKRINQQVIDALRGQ